MNLNPRRSEPRNIKPGAIVLGGNFVGLGVARSLGAHGIPVWVVDADRSKSIAQFSRYTKRFFECKENLVEFLLREGRHHDLQGWVLFPTTDESVEMVSANHESLSSIYQLAAPRAEITQFALDKRLTYSRAAELGIATPWTATGNHPSDVEDRNPPYPLILKPAVNHHFFRTPTSRHCRWRTPKSCINVSLRCAATCPPTPFWPRSVSRAVERINSRTARFAGVERSSLPWLRNAGGNIPLNSATLAPLCKPSNSPSSNPADAASWKASVMTELAK